MWKCAVLRRRPGGADHLGHLFLVVAAPEVRVEPEAFFTTLGAGFGAPRLFRSGGAGGTLQVIARPLASTDPEPLFVIARQLADHLGPGSD